MTSGIVLAMGAEVALNATPEDQHELEKLQYAERPFTKA